MQSIFNRFPKSPHSWFAGLGVAAVVGGLLAAPRLIARPPADGPTPREAFAEMQAQAGGGLTVHWNDRTGIPDFLSGPIPYHLTEAERADPKQAAFGVLNRWREVFDLRDPAGELAVMRIESDDLGQTHVRLRQIHRGVAVWATSLYVHVGPSGILGINGVFVPGLDVPTEPALTLAQAQAAALAAAKDETPSLFGQAELTIYVADDGAATLTWKIPLETARPSDRLAYFVDAGAGVIVHITPLMPSDKYRVIYDAQLKESLPGKLLAQEGEVPRDAAGKAVYQHLGTVYDYFKKTFNRDSFDNHGAEMRGVIHSPNLGNSFWDGEQMVFGDTDGYLTTKADAFVLDIVAHEFTHAVTEHTAGLVYEGQSGALNESFSDVFAVMVDRDDWHLFEDNTASPPAPTPWLRDMEDPSLGGDYDRREPGAGFGQPTTMADYANLPVSRDADWGGVHINSGIPNHTLYLAATASSREATEQIWYRALTAYLTEKSDFTLFSLAIQQAATDLYGANSREMQAVQAALKKQGLPTTGGAAAGPAPVPTSAPRVTSAPTPTQIVSAGCTQVVGNGGFEAARAEPWIEITALQVPIIGPDFPRTGRQSAWLGGTDKESFQYLYQDIAVPSNAKSAALTYWYYLYEELAMASAPAASFSVIVADQQGAILETLEEFASSQADETWTQSTLDMSAYAGKKIRLAFVAGMVPKNTSSFFVDDVTIQACTTGTPAATPPPSGAGVKVTGTVSDSATGRAIQGAVIYILKPGVSASSAAADGQIGGNEYLTEGVSDRNGYFELKDRLPRGQVYSAIVIATGYRTIYADNGFEIRPNDTDPVTLTVEMQKGF